MQQVIENIKSKFKVLKQDRQKNSLFFVTVPREQLENVLMYLKEFQNYNYLTIISAVDFIEKNLFQLTYLLQNIHTHTDIGIRMEIERTAPEMTSINHLWAAASVYEREIKELYGIDFPGCPRVDESFVLEGWDNIPPMRRDFDTKKYSEETFFPREGRYTLDPAERMEEKMYPEETEVKHEIKKQFRKGQN